MSFLSRNKPASKKDVRVNLLPKDPFYDSMIGKGTTWALSIGRYIVIFTEIVVILSFVSRFQLDRQVTDLNNEILQKSNIIQSYGDLEQNIRDIQKKIEVYEQLKTTQPIQDIFVVLTQITPEEIEYKELGIKSDTISITGRTRSTQALTRFLTNIQATPYFSNVVVDNISNKDARNPGFDFNIKAIIVPTQ